MTDERAYRGNNHPPTCLCVDCEVARLRQNVWQRLVSYIKMPFEMLRFWQK